MKIIRNIDRLRLDLTRLSRKIHPSRNQSTKTFWPRNLRGAEKAWVQTLIITGMASYAWRNRRRLGLEPSDFPGYMKDLFTLSEGPKELKYVHFGSKVFVDAWTPPFPADEFFRALTAVPSFVNATDPTQAGACIYTVFSLTNRCMYRCEHCYTSHTLGREDQISREKLLETVDTMLEIGTGVLSFEGGEPLLRYDDLLDLLDLCKGRTNPYIATTGWSLTPEKARELADRGLVAVQVSLDHYDPDKHNAMRKSPKAFDVAVNALRMFREAGIFPMISMVATPELLDEGGLFRFLEFGKKHGVGMIQVLDPLPSGANASDQEASRVLTKKQRDKIFNFHIEANTDPKWKDYPNISARLYTESERSLGCGWGGLGIYYIDSFGNVEPCPYANMSVGNILEEDFEVIYKRMRELFPRPIGGLCPAYQLTQEEKRARDAGETLPLSPQRTAEVAGEFSKRPLPKLLRKIARNSAR